MNPPATQKRRVGQANRPATIEDLPPEMICELFKHLSVVDLAACSQVNKRWRSIYAAFKVDALAVTDNAEDKWIYSNRNIEEFEFCRPEQFSKLADRPLLSNLKHLALYRHRNRRVEPFALYRLQSFAKLVHLEIVARHCKEALNHRELKVLVCRYNTQYLSIDCPKLRVLVYEEYERDNLLDVKHPETIRELQTNMFGPKLDRFKNVECLVTERIEAISKSTLKSLPGLKKLHYNTHIKYALWKFRSHEAGALNGMKLTLREFLNDTKASDLQLRFAGLQITAETLDQIDFGVRVEAGREKVCNEYVYLKNYHLIEPDALHFMDQVNYGRLMINGELPACFAQKFSGIETVFSGDKPVQDALHFGLFLKCMRSLRNLHLVSSELGQEFYDQLSTFAPSLATLKMKAHGPTGLFNFEFLYELPRFRELTLVGKLTYDESVLFIRLFDDLEQAEVTFQLERVSDELGLQVIKQRGASQWSVWGEDGDDDLLDGSSLYNLNLHQLLEYLEKLFR